MSVAIQSRAVANFTCLGDACADTCCKGWGMQLTRETVDKYTAQAPELLAAVSSGESEFIMKRDPNTDYCVKFDAGWCGIHRDYGASMLGDACHFYPRITRAIGDTVMTTAALSCPESARAMLFEDDAFATVPSDAARVPFSLKHYTMDGLGEAEILGLHTLFLQEAGNAEYSAEMNLMRLSTVTQAMSVQPVAEWLNMAPFYFKMALGRVPAAQAVATDPFNLLHALHGLVAASKPTQRPRLQQTIDSMAEMLGVRFVGAGITLAEDAAQRFLSMQHAWRQHGGMQDVLRHYLQAQVSIAFLPFAGLGNTLPERVTIFGVRLATTKLALMAETKKLGAPLDEPTTVRVVQGLSRFLDHLADPTLSLQIYHEAGWVREPRLRALMME